MCTLLHKGLKFKHYTAQLIEPSSACEFMSDVTNLTHNNEDPYNLDISGSTYGILNPFGSAATPILPSSSQQGLISLSTDAIIWQCFEPDSGYWQPPGGSVSWLSDVLTSFTRRVTLGMVYIPQKLTCYCLAAMTVTCRQRA